MKKLTDLMVGQTAKILKIEAPIKLKRRLFDLGFVQTTQVKILAKSALKKTYLIYILDGAIAIKEDNLRGVFVC